MQLTIKIKLLPTKTQMLIINNTAKEYIKTVNGLVSQMMEAGNYLTFSSKNVYADLPSALRCQCALDSKSIYKKFKKTNKHIILKKPVAVWNNQNYKVTDNSICFPVWIANKSKRIEVKALLTERHKQLLANKLGTLRITKINGKLIAQVAVEVSEYQSTTAEGRTLTMAEGRTLDGVPMGIDLGLKIPAVAAINNGKTKFFGNGRQNKYMKRRFRTKRKKLGKAKKQNAINKINNKDDGRRPYLEQRWMKDKDHKTSRAIVNFAKSNNVSVIRLEQLQSIRNTARTSRKNEKNLHTWSFYRLAQYIEYKAMLEGIKVEYVNPKYTSQICPACGTRNHAIDRKYRCSCGYTAHRDRVGALNIINAPVVAGNRQSA